MNPPIRDTCEILCPIEQMMRLPYQATATGPCNAIFEVNTQGDSARMQSELASIGAEHPEIAEIAMVLADPQPERHAYRVWQFLRNTVRYVREPGERICHPIITLERGMGDCDDMAILATALVRSAGLRARISHINQGAAGAHAISRLWTGRDLIDIDGTQVWGYPKWR